MLLQGTRTSSKKISAVSDDHMPSLSILRATCTPAQRQTVREREGGGRGGRGEASPTWQVQGQADERLVPVRRPVTSVRQQTHPVGLHAVGGPHLPAVDDQLIALPDRLGHNAW